ncbi:anaerobic ribonucleoside-triphosphate reductase [Acidovorax sp. Q11]
MSYFSSAEHTALAAVQLTDAERQPCEVWTRVMGYHRPVASFNTGKQGEHAERRFFAEAPRRGCGNAC